MKSIRSSGMDRPAFLRLLHIEDMGRLRDIYSASAGSCTAWMRDMCAGYGTGLVRGRWRHHPDHAAGELLLRLPVVGWQAHYGWRNVLLHLGNYDFQTATIDVS